MTAINALNEAICAAGSGAGDEAAPKKEARRDVLARLFETKTREEIIELALQGGDYADQADEIIAGTRRLVVSLIRDQLRISRHRTTLYRLIAGAARLSELAQTSTKQSQRQLALSTVRKELANEAVQATEVERLDQERKTIVERLMADNEWIPRDILAAPDIILAAAS